MTEITVPTWAIETGTIPVSSPAKPARRPRVGWSTVAPMAVVMAYADGFWLTSLREAVGAIERTQGPFASWLREATLFLPVFVLAVLGAVTLAGRWFGPTGKRRNSFAAALLIAAAGTLVGVAEVGVSAAYDYHLQTLQLRAMDSMETTSCVGRQCTAAAQHAALWVQLHAVALSCVALLAANVILVLWIAAMRGGRVEVATRGFARGVGTLAHDARLLLAAGLIGNAVIHIAVVPEHLKEWPAAGLFFCVLAGVELLLGLMVIIRPGRTAVLIALAASIGPLLLWAVSRSVGMPFGPEPDTPETVGLADCVACVLEVGTLLLAVVLLRRTSRLTSIGPCSPHMRSMALVAVVALTAIGLAGTSLSALGYAVDPGTDIHASATH